MYKLFGKLLPVLIATPLLLSLGGCPCGFNCSSSSDDDDNTPATLTLGLSDASVEELSQVVIEIDSITLTRSAADDVVIDTFTIDKLNLTDVSSFQVDLLDYRGRNQLVVIDALELDVGSYNEVVVKLLDGDINFSFVQENDGSIKVLNAPTGGISLPGVVLASGQQAFTIEFGLAQALQYQGTSDTYLLASEGVRIEDNATAAGLTGRVDSTLFDQVTPCDAKTDPESGNRIYLYSGTGLSPSELADVHTTASDNNIPDDALAPFAVATLVENVLTAGWDYAFGFLPVGSYTLAMSCDAADDDPVDYDDIVVPLPTDQVYEISLSEGEQSVCDLADDAQCD
jgi:hypothetical protein